MDKWVEQVNRRAQILMDQIIATRLAAQHGDVDLTWLEKQNRSLLEQLYAEEYAGARLRDTSDLVVRAEGPGADHGAPTLHSLNWLTQHVREQLMQLSAAVIPMAADNAQAVARRMPWVFTGYAPGSIMLGFALRRPEALAGFEESDAHAFSLIDQASQAIAVVPQYVDDDELRAEIADQLTEPALRDAAVLAAWQLSPTSQSGIHTVQVASRGGQFGSLSMRERMVLKKSVERPLMRRTQFGRFTGSLRAADLDKHRGTLRGVNGVGTIRCVLSAGHLATTQQLFGGRVVVSGYYETNLAGQPSLMRVEKIERAPPSADLFGPDDNY